MPARLAALLTLLFSSALFAAPRWTRLSWTGKTDSTITVSWTDNTAGAGQLEVKDSAGTLRTWPATAVSTGTSELDVTYVATALNLSPSVEYQYRVQSSGTYSAWGTFRTAPAQGSCGPLRFVAGGDSRGEEVPVIGYTSSLQWQSIANAMSAEKPLFSMHSGDFVRAGDQASQWVTEMPSLTSLASTAPFFLSIGNHDDGPGVGPTARFNSLFEYASMGSGTDDFYAFVAGNVLVANLSTYTGSMDAQLTWLRGVLDSVTSGIDWRVVMFHTPVWSSGAHGNNEEDRARADVLVPLLDQYGVDLVINGHDHDYERFHPSKGGYGGVPRVFTPLSLDQGRRGTANGTVYVVSGGAGALTNPIFTASSTGSAFGSKQLHYLVVDVSGGSLTLTVRDCGSQGVSGATCTGAIETVRLEKTATCGVSSPDAGLPVQDAGVVPADAGSQVADAGEDAGATPDAGSPSQIDAGQSASDAGNSTSTATGCGCTGATGGLLAMAAFLATLVARRGRSKVSL